MDKIVGQSSFTFDGADELVQIVDNPDNLKRKVANHVRDSWGEIKPQKGRTFVHIIALSSFEKTGCNLNADAFEEKVCKESHPTFSKTARLYRNHKRTEEKDKDGDVAKTAYNDKQGRVELLLSAIDDKCADWLGELEKGNKVDFSMGWHCSDGDICSICNNRAHRRSDYCFIKGTEVTTWDGCIVPIEDIKEGDYVMDQNGSPTKVIKLFCRQVDEDVVRIKTSLSGIDTVTTKNHPILTLPGEASGFYNIDNCHYYAKINDLPVCEREGFGSFSISPDFISAGFLRPKDFVFCPIIDVREFRQLPEDVDEQFAWVCGLFVAEGCYSKNNKQQRNSIQFSLNDEKEQHIIERLKLFFLSKFGANLKVYKTKNSKGCSCRINSIEIANKFFDLCGEYAYDKRFHEGFFNTTNEIKKAFLDGLFEGDGHQYSRQGRTTYTRLNSCSRSLVNRVWHMLSQLKEYSYYSRFLNAGGPSNRTNKKDGFYVNTSYGCQLEKSMLTGRGYIDNQVVGYIIKITDEHYAGNVYNIETESGTYIASGITVHNCDHLKKNASAPYGLGKILPDGRRCFTYNRDGYWNDISKVNTGADMVACDLAKVASHNDGAIGGAELAEIIYGNFSDISEKEKVAYEMGQIFDTTSSSGITPMRCGKRLSQKSLSKIAEHKLEDVFHTARQLGTAICFDDFCDMVVQKIGKRIEEEISSAQDNFDTEMANIFSNKERLKKVASIKTYDIPGKPILSRDFDTVRHDLSFQGKTASIVDGVANKKFSKTIGLTKIAQTLIESYAAYKISCAAALGAGSKENMVDFVLLN